MFGGQAVELFSEGTLDGNIIKAPAASGMFGYQRGIQCLFVAAVVSVGPVVVQVEMQP